MARNTGRARGALADSAPVSVGDGPTIIIMIVGYHADCSRGRARTAPSVIVIIIMLTITVIVIIITLVGLSL